MRAVAAIAFLAVSAGGALGATGSGPTLRDTDTDPLRRAAFVTTPAVYEVSVEITVKSLVTHGRRRSINRTVAFKGAGFGVAQGAIVTARHLLVPPPERLAEELTARGVTGLPSTFPNGGASFETDPEPEVRVRRAVTADATLASGGNVPQPVEPTITNAGDAQDDVALLGVAQSDADPTVRLADETTIATPVAVLGFGNQSATAQPAVRLGRIAGQGRIGDAADFAILDVPIVRGDSGAPVIDVDGEVVGIVIRRANDGTGPVMARVPVIRRLLAGENLTNSESASITTFRTAMVAADSENLTNSESASITTFRTAMVAFWARDYARAETLLGPLGDAYPNATLVRAQAARAHELSRARYAVVAPSRIRTAVLAVGLTAALAAAALGLLRFTSRRLAT